MQLRAQAPQYENARMQYSEIKEEIYHSMTMTEPFLKRWTGVFEGNISYPRQQPCSEP